jgi:hypothetical protein
MQKLGEKNKMADELKISPPLYLIGKKIHCWRCSARMPVVTLLAPNVEDMAEEVCILSNVRYLPNELLSYLQKRVQTYKLKYSKTEGEKYYANTCTECGVLSGDFFLHSEPGAPFFPEDEEEAKHLYITEVPLSTPITIRASYCMGFGDVILESAKRI